ncbi:MAG: hypothetical protein KBD79_12390 [Chitinophagales bacterium]|nr:hypothetical protein [Chitinophagales bacterium]
MSCKKPDLEKGIVNGLVNDRTTNEGIPDATVYLLAHEPNGSIFGGGGGPSFTVDTTTSDTQGKFSFNFEYDDNYAYTCYALKDLYYDYNDEIPIDANIKDNINVQILLIPKSFLKLHIKDQEEYLENYELRLVPFSSPFVVNAFMIDTVLIGSVNGNESFDFTWVLDSYITDEIIINNATIYCPSFDTVLYEILY